MIRERRNIMKTTGIKMNGYRLTVIGLLLCTMTMQAVAVDYKNQYKVHSTISNQSSVVSIQTTAPSVGFQSTSVYSGQWNQDAQQSMLNADGSINHEAYMGGQNVSGMRKAPNGPGTPGGDLDPTHQQPLGDAVLPLLLFALVYAGVRLRKRAINLRNKAIK